MAVDGYTSLYDANEISEVSIDLGMGILVSLVSFVTIIGLVLLYGWFKKKKPKF